MLFSERTKEKTDVKRKLTVAVLALLMVITFNMPERVFAAEDAVEVSTEAQLNAAIADAGTDEESRTEIVVTKNITLSAPVTVPSGKYISLKGNTAARKITIAGSFSSAQRSETYAMIQSHGDIQIESLKLDGNLLMRVLCASGAGTSVTLNDGAVITGGLLGRKTQVNGVGVRISGRMSDYAKLIINEGARVTGNKKEGSGGTDFAVNGIGVYIDSYTNAYMYGGEIANNIDYTTENHRKAAEGAGVDLYGATSTFDMYGGTICGNVSKDSGGGIQVSGGTFNFRGGSITGNEVEAAGAGIAARSEVNIYEGAEISENAVHATGAYGEMDVSSNGNGGGIYVDTAASSNGSSSSSEKKVTMYGGTITGNTAESQAKNLANQLDVGQGGGIYVHSGGIDIRGGSVTGNSAVSPDKKNPKAGNGGGIAIGGGNDAGYARIKDTEVTGNTASKCGSDVYLNADVTTAGSTSAPTEYDEQGYFYLDSGCTAGSVFIPENAFFYVSGPLTGSDVCVDSENTVPGTVVAESTDEYRVLPRDARALKTSDGKKIYNVSKNKIVIGEERDQYTDISGAVIGNIDAAEYTGSSIEPELTVTLDGKELARGTDYEAQYENNKNAGTATVTVHGNGEYDGAVSAQFEILPRNISNADIQDIRRQIYTGQAVEPEVRIYDGPQILKKDRDYTAEYSDNDAVGTGHVRITGTGNYTGERSVPFEIISSDGISLVDTEEDLISAIDAAGSDPASPTEIYIGNIGVTETIVIPEGKSVKFIGMKGDSGLYGSKDEDGGSFADNMIENRGRLETEGIILSAERTGLNGNGRAIMNDGNAVLVIGADTLVTKGNKSRGSGIYNAGDLQVEGGLITGNTYSASQTMGNDKQGGGVYNEGTMSMSAGEIRENTHISGGGIFNAGTADISGGYVTENKANGNMKNLNNGYGGGICNSGVFNASDLYITNNSSTDFGGGIYNSGAMDLEDSHLTGNEAVVGGAGICSATENEDRVLTCTGCVIEENSLVNALYDRVTASGGGIMVRRGKVSAKNCIIRGNLAKSRYQTSSASGSMGCGGGVYISNDPSSHCIFEMDGGEITGNTAQASARKNEMGCGGGIYVLGGKKDGEMYPGELILRDVAVRTNTASEKGSGVFLNDREYAYGYGSFLGNIDVDAAGKSTMKISGNTSVTENTDDDIYLRGGTRVDTAGQLTCDAGAIGVIADETQDSVISKGSDYTVTEEDAEKFINEKGIRKVTLDGSKNQIYLKAVPLNEAFVIKFTGSETAEYPFTGGEIDPEVQVVSVSGDEVLTEGVDYTLEYENKVIDTGEYEVAAYGDGDYTDYITGEYTVVPRSLSDVTAKLPDQIYTGKAIKFVPSLGMIKLGAYTLSRNTDYSIVSNGYKNNTGPGRASMVIKGMDNFTGKKTIYYNIYKAMSKMKVASVPDKAYTGKAIKPSVTVKDGRKKLVRGADYTISYSSNKAIGTATINIKGKGDYTGTKKVKFRIVPKKNVIKKLKRSGSGAVKVTWKKDKTVSGYQVVAGTNKACTKNKKTVLVKTFKKVTAKLTKLKAGKTYYVKVRAYKTVSGKKFYGAFSKAGKIKVK